MSSDHGVPQLSPSFRLSHGGWAEASQGATNLEVVKSGETLSRCNLCLPFGCLWDVLLECLLQTVATVQVDSGGRACGVVLQDGTEVRSKVVLSNASPQTTFLELTPQVRLGLGSDTYQDRDENWGARTSRC